MVCRGKSYEMDDLGVTLFQEWFNQQQFFLFSGIFISMQMENLPTKREAFDFGELG